jgi:murein DD-endopeptidase MepM/ murein hydrolase activator NlpD
MRPAPSPRHYRVGALTLVGLLAVTAAADADLPAARPVPGGIALVDVGAATGPVPSVLSDTHRVLVRSDHGRFIAVVGIPLAAVPGRASISVAASTGPARPVGYDIQPKEYVTQALKVEPKHVDLAPADLKRYEGEKVQMEKMFASWTDAPPATLSLAAPVPGVRQSSFGSRRVFNGQSRNPHTGMDMTAPTGERVLAPAAGTVVGTGDFFFNGNTVIIDHGQGLLTLFCHLSRVDVAVGDHVARGQALGLVGATGRATGPHLHFGVMLNRAWIDPGLLLEPVAPAP